MDPRIAQVAQGLATGAGRVCFLLDAENRLVWVSRELRGFLGATDDTSLGVGQHLASAWLSPAWQRAVTPESGLRLVREITQPHLPAESPSQEPRESPRAGVKRGVPPMVWTGHLDYAQPALPPYPIDFVSTSLRDETGQLIATMVLMYLRLRPGLVALLGRGDEAMYERMARLIQPERRATAILFADLQDSGELSRALPTAAYFNLIRELTATFDLLVGEHRGIVGKHAGDGWTAFVLADDAGDASRAVAGCLEISRKLHTRATTRSEALGFSAPSTLRINSGVHWGPGVYLGQLVPGGRLEVTALGDEVNECARIQQCARGGSMLASKQALELLSSRDAQHLGIDPTRLAYQPLASMPGATDKARRDAGILAVAPVPIR